MTLFNVIAVIEPIESIRIYDATGAEEEKDIKCIYSGTALNLDFSIDLDHYIVERIALDGEFISFTVVKKG